MTIPFAKLGKMVADVLTSSGYKVEMYNEDNNRVYDKEEARKFFTTPDNIMVAIHDEGDEKSKLKVDLSDGVDIAEFEKKVGKRLRNIANQIGDNMSYDIRTYGHQLSLKDYAFNPAVKEGTDTMSDSLSEGQRVKMTGTTRSSYQRIGECRLIIRHSTTVNEDKFGARSRNIQAIFVETKEGERFKVPENNLHGARALARHISNGGNPYDVIGQKISEMMTKMSKLHGLMKEVRSMSRNDVIAEDATNLAEQIRTQYGSIRETLRKMSGKIGYKIHTEDLQEQDEDEQKEGQMNEKKIDELGPATGKQYKSILKPQYQKGAPHGPGDVTAVTPPSSEKPTVTDKEVFALIASDPKYGRRHLRPERDYWDESDYKLYKAAKAELQKKKTQMNSVEEDDTMQYVAPDNKEPKAPTQFGNPMSELVFKIGEYLETKSADPKLDDDGNITNPNYLDDKVFNALSRLSEKLGRIIGGDRDVELTPGEKKLAFAAARELGVDLKRAKAESIEESSDVEGDITVSQEDADKHLEQEAFESGREDDLFDEDYEDMHSVNSIALDKTDTPPQKDYGILPEHKILESWFDDMIRVEFYKEEDLALDEDTGPKIEKILPETALDTLNMYMGHPLFKHYVSLYDTQGILDEVVDMMEDGSTLLETTVETRKRLNEFAPGNESAAMDAAFDELKLKIQGRMEGVDEAIEEIAEKLANELHGGDQEAKMMIASELRHKAEEAGMIKHDAGSDFADDVLSPSDELENDSNEIDAEEYYGDSRFHEEGDGLDEMPMGSMEDPGQGYRIPDEEYESSHSYQTDQHGGVEIYNNETGKSVYLQPGDDANTFLDEIENAASPRHEDDIMSSYESEMEEASVPADPELNRIRELSGLGEAKKKADKDYDGDGEVESPDDEWRGSRDKAIKKSMKEDEVVQEKKANKDYDGDGEIESTKDEWKGSRDKAIKKATKKDEAVNETVTDQNLARIIQLAKYKN